MCDELTCIATHHKSILFGTVFNHGMILVSDVLSSKFSVFYIAKHPLILCCSCDISLLESYGRLMNSHDFDQ